MCQLNRLFYFLLQHLRNKGPMSARAIAALCRPGRSDDASVAHLKAMIQMRAYSNERLRRNFADERFRHGLRVRPAANLHHTRRNQRRCSCMGKKKGKKSSRGIDGLSTNSSLYCALKTLRKVEEASIRLVNSEKCADAGEGQQQKQGRQY
jgi:hypothetical protein